MSLLEVFAIDKQEQKGSEKRIKMTLSVSQCVLSVERA